MAHLSSLYTWEWKFGQTMWDKIEVLMGTNWELGEPFGNWARTSCEYDGNTFGNKRKKIPQLSPPLFHPKTQKLMSAS